MQCACVHQEESKPYSPFEKQEGSVRLTALRRLKVQIAYINNKQRSTRNAQTLPRNNLRKFGKTGILMNSEVKLDS